MDMEICAKYAEDMRHGIIAAVEARRKGQQGLAMFRWLAIPLDLAKNHDAKYVPCLLFLLESSGFIPAQAIENTASMLKGLPFFTEDSLDAFLEIDEVRRVTPSHQELRDLSMRIANAINAPDERLMREAMNWLDTNSN